MANPNFPISGDGTTKIGFLAYVSSGQPLAALYTAVVTQAESIFSNAKGWLGIATHRIGYVVTGAVNEPGVFAAGRVRTPSAKTTDSIEGLSLDPLTGNLFVEARTSVGAPLHIQPGILPTWTSVQSPIVDGVVTLTKAATASTNHYVLGYTVAVLVAAPTQDMTITLEANGSSVQWYDAIGATSVRGTRTGAAFAWPGMQFPTNNSVVLRVTSPGGAGTNVIAAMYGYSLPSS